MKQIQFCLICGTKYPDQQAPFIYTCDHCGYIYHENQTVSTVGVILHQGKILLTQRKLPPHQGAWDLPGGFVHPTEHPEQAMIREIREELGVECMVKKLLFVFAPVEYIYKDKMQYNCDLVYLIVTNNFELQPNDDVATVRWFGKDDLPDDSQLSFVSIKEVVNRFREGKLES